MQHRRAWSLGVFLFIGLLHLWALKFLNEMTQNLPAALASREVDVSLLLDEPPHHVPPATHQSPVPPAPPPAASPAPQVNPEGLTSSPEEVPGLVPATTSASAAEPTTLPQDAQFQFPQANVLSYEVHGQSKGLKYFASGRLQWQPQATSYRAQLEISAFLLGSRAFVSQGQWSPAGLRPQIYQDPARADQAAQFDYEARVIRYADHSPDAPLTEGTQDRLSVFLQLGALLASQPDRYPLGTMLPVMTTSTSAVDLWQFNVEKTEVLTLPWGTLDTLKLSRRLRHPEDQSIEVWYAPSLGDLPVRMLITKPNGDFVDQQLKAVENPSP